MPSSIRFRLTAGLATLVVLGCLQAVVGSLFVGQSRARLERMYTQEVVPLEALDDAKSAMYRIRGDSLEHILSRRTASRRGLEAEIAVQSLRLDQRLAQYRSADGERVAGRVGRSGERVLHHARRRVDGGADRQVDDAAGVGAGGVGVRREAVPRELGQTRARRPPRTGGRRGTLAAQWPSRFLPSGTAMITGWSTSTGPTLLAPPGLPMFVVSVKKSTFAR